MATPKRAPALRSGRSAWRRTVLSHDAVRSCPLGRAATSQTVSEWPCVMGEAEWRRPLGHAERLTVDKQYTNKGPNACLQDEKRVRPYPHDRSLIVRARDDGAVRKRCAWRDRASAA